jgi:chromosome segregation ATPase
MSKQSLPRVVGGILVPSEGTTIEIATDTKRWHEWLDNAQSFRYIPNSKESPFTVRKEINKQGGAYWSGYRKVAGILDKLYIGKSTNLTVEILEEAAVRLNKPREPRKKSKVIDNLTKEISVTNSTILYATNEDIAQLWDALRALRQEFEAKDLVVDIETTKPQSNSSITNELSVTAQEICELQIKITELQKKILQLHKQIQDQDEQLQKINLENQYNQGQLHFCQEENQKLRQENQELQNKLSNHIQLDYEVIRDRVLTTWKLARRAESKDRIKEALDRFIDQLRTALE